MKSQLLRPAGLCFLLALPLLGCGTGGHVRPGQPVGPPAEFEDTDVVSRIFLVGDAGDLGGARAVMPEVLARMDERSYAVFLGDNVYDWEDREAVLSAHLDAASRGRGALFIAGNHDWDAGFEGLQWQVEAVRAAGGDWLPEPGCPGPAVKELPGVRILALDSEWWLRDPESRPALDCADGDAALEALAAELDRSGDPVIVAAHHPLESFGKHGGKFPWTQHLLPPVFGSIYVWVRQGGAFHQDTPADTYAEWIAGMRAAMRAHPPLLAAHGHEHSLQVLAGGGIAEANGVEGAPGHPAVVSGSGSKTSWVGAGDRTLFSSGDRGFALVTVLASGAVGLELFHLDDEGDCLRGWAGWLTAPDGVVAAPATHSP